MGNFLKEIEEEEEKLFRKARNYLSDNFDRNITMDQLSEEIGIERRLINKWIKEGRFNKSKVINRSDDIFLEELIKSRDNIKK